MEIQDYGKCLQTIKSRGDPVAVEVALGALLDAVKDVMAKWLRRNRDWTDAEEVMQWAALAILEAAEVYDAGRGSGINFVRMRVRRRLSGEYKYFASTMGREVRTQLGNDKRIIADPVDRIAEFDDRDEARHWFPILMGMLRGKERAVFGKYVAGISLREIAKELGIKADSAWNAMRRVRAKISYIRLNAEAT